jgi:hypothetical protein
MSVKRWCKKVVSADIEWEEKGYQGLVPFCEPELEGMQPKFSPSFSYLIAD